MLKVKKLHAYAKLPTVAHPGEDLGYDLFALEDVKLFPDVMTKVRTGIAVEAFTGDEVIQENVGLLIRDRSSMAAQGIFVSGGVIDAGYRGEIVVMMSLLSGPRSEGKKAIEIKAGQKIAQMIPVPVLTGAVVEVDELPASTRGEAGFGSSGRF